MTGKNVAESSSIGAKEYRILFTKEVVLGMLNNLGFILVISGAQDISRLFDKADLMPLFTTVMLASAFLVGALHARLAAPFSYRQRVAFGMSIQILGYFLFGTSFLFVGVAPNVGFWMAQLATFLVGAFQTIGEVNNLAVLHSLPSSLVGAWGFGTGVSQLVGSVAYMAVLGMGVPHSTFFYSLIPLYVIYWVLFVQMDNTRVAIVKQNQKLGLSDPLLPGSTEEGVRMTSDTLKIVFRISGFVILNMCATYGLNYLIESGLVDRATLHPEPLTSAIAVNAYTLTVTSYGVGTMLARLSVAWMPTSRVGSVTLVQLAMALLWGFEAYFHVVRSFGLSGWWFYQAWMFFVGVVAGMSYANCLTVISQSKEIPTRYRELVMNVAFICSNVAVVFATGSSIIMNATFMSAQQLYPWAY